MARHTNPKTAGELAVEEAALEAKHEREALADAKAIPQMTPEQIEAARFCRMAPSEWLYWSRKRSRWSLG